MTNKFSLNDLSTIILRIFFTGSGFIVNFILYNNFNLETFTNYILFIAAAETLSSILKFGMPTVLLKLASDLEANEKYLKVLSSFNSFSLITLSALSFLSFFLFKVNYIQSIFILVPFASLFLTYHVVIFNLLRSKISYNKIIYLESFVKNISFLLLLFCFNNIDESLIIIIFLVANIISLLFLIYYANTIKLKIFSFSLNKNFFRSDGIQIGFFNILQTVPKQVIYFSLKFYELNNLIAQLKLALSFVNVIKIPNVAFATKFSPKLVQIKNMKLENFYLNKNFIIFSYTFLAFVLLYFIVPDFIFELIIYSNSSKIVSLAMLISIHILIDACFSLNGTLLLMKSYQNKLLKNYFISNIISLTIFLYLLYYSFNPKHAVISFFIINSIIANFLNNLSLLKKMNINSYKLFQ